MAAMRHWGDAEGAIQIINDTKDAGKLKVQIGGESSPSAKNAKVSTQAD
jgi:hypothetical protein